MLPSKDFGIVIWGLRNGFEKKIVISQEVEEVMSIVNDDMRIICNATNERFYCVDRLPNYNIFTIFNSDTSDNFGRKAYIAISLFTPANRCIAGDVADILSKLMNFYSSKQGRSSENVTNLQQYIELLANVHTTALDIPQRRFNTAGYHLIRNESVFKLNFSTPKFANYNRVFFITQNNSSIEHNSQYEEIKEFVQKKEIQLRLNNFRSNEHSITVNGEITRHIDLGQLFYLKVFAGDIVEITQNGSIVHHMEVSEYSTIVNIPFRTVDPIPTPRPIPGSENPKPYYSPYYDSREEESSGKSKWLLYIVIAFIIVGGGILSYVLLTGSDEAVPTVLATSDAGPSDDTTNLDSLDLTKECPNCPPQYVLQDIKFAPILDSSGYKGQNATTLWRYYNGKFQKSDSPKKWKDLDKPNQNSLLRRYFTKKADSETSVTTTEKEKNNGGGNGGGNGGENGGGELKNCDCVKIQSFFNKKIDASMKETAKKMKKKYFDCNCKVVNPVDEGILNEIQ